LTDQDQISYAQSVQGLSQDAKVFE